MRAKVDYLEKMFFHLKGNRIGEEQPVDSRGPFQRYDNDVLLASPSVKVTSLSQPAGNTYYISPSHWEAVMDCVRETT